MNTKWIGRALCGAVAALGLASPVAHAGGLPGVSISKNDLAAAQSGAKGHYLSAHPQANAAPSGVSIARVGGADLRGNRSGGSRDKSRYLGDLSNFGGATLPSVQHHGLFLINPATGCTTTACWGDPLGFLADLSRSDMAHVTDQYVGAHKDNRYPVGDSYYVTIPGGLPNPADDGWMMGIAAYVADLTGEVGYGHLWHIFLAPGQDECFSQGGQTFCYSPDVPATFYFCAYHSSFSDATGNEILYSVEPFQNVQGCQVRPGTPNGQLTDSTNNVLSHEVFETITDPDGASWINGSSLPLLGEEIGDECSFVTFTSTGPYFDPTDVTLNGRHYSVQPEYSNRDHACVVSP